MALTELTWFWNNSIHIVKRDPEIRDTRTNEKYTTVTTTHLFQLCCLTQVHPRIERRHIHEQQRALQTRTAVQYHYGTIITRFYKAPCRIRKVYQ